MSAAIGLFLMWRRPTPYAPSSGVRDGVGVLVLVRGDQAVLDVAPTHAVRAQQHQRPPLVRRQLHHLKMV